MGEETTFLEEKEKRKRATQGKLAESKVREVLTRLRTEDPTFGFERPVDTRAAGRMMPPTVADFICRHAGKKDLALEVKSTQHLFRIGPKAFPQHPRMLQFCKTGGRAYVVVYHMPVRKWRLINAEDLPKMSTGSWDLSSWEPHANLDQLLRTIL